jgi:hypothetical protein
MAWKYLWRFRAGVIVSIFVIIIIAVVTRFLVGAKRKPDENTVSTHLAGIRPDSGIETLSFGSSILDSY